MRGHYRNSPTFNSETRETIAERETDLQESNMSGPSIEHQLYQNDKIQQILVQNNLKKDALEKAQSLLEYYVEENAMLQKENGRLQQEVIKWRSNCHSIELSYKQQIEMLTAQVNKYEKKSFLQFEPTAMNHPSVKQFVRNGSTPQPQEEQESPTWQFSERVKLLDSSKINKVQHKRTQSRYSPIQHLKEFSDQELIMPKPQQIQEVMNEIQFYLSAEEFSFLYENYDSVSAVIQDEYGQMKVMQKQTQKQKQEVLLKKSANQIEKRQSSESQNLSWNLSFKASQEIKKSSDFSPLNIIKEYQKLLQQSTTQISILKTYLYECLYFIDQHNRESMEDLQSQLPPQVGKEFTKPNTDQQNLTDVDLKDSLKLLQIVKQQISQTIDHSNRHGLFEMHRLKQENKELKFILDELADTLEIQLPRKNSKHQKYQYEFSDDRYLLDEESTGKKTSNQFQQRQYLSAQKESKFTAHTANRNVSKTAAKSKHKFRCTTLTNQSEDDSTVFI